VIVRPLLRGFPYLERDETPPLGASSFYGKIILGRGDFATIFRTKSGGNSPNRLLNSFHQASLRSREIMSEKPSATLSATVEKIIKSPHPDEPEKAQIAVEGADHLYREIRIENTLTNEHGEEVSLKPGAQVEVTVEAEPEATIPKNHGNQQTASVP
jgi:hypothetical protein